MGTAKTINLVARSTSSANLAFEIGGIVLESDAILGQQVKAFDFPSFYKTLGVATEPKKGKPVRLPPGLKKPPPFTPYLDNSSDLDSQLEKNSLMRLRAEPIRALLDKTCLARANIYMNKYAYVDDIKATAQSYYAGNNSKAAILSELYSLSAAQAEALAAAYIADNIGDNGAAGVVRQASATTETTTNTFDDNKTTTTGMADYAGSPYRHPFIEAAAQGYRAQISLNDERFTTYLATLSVNHLDQVLNNELAAADQDVRRIQASYMSTILFPPIGGTITGIYKRVGEAVMAGEPVLRVENNDTVNVTGSIIYNGAIALGDEVTVGTTLFGAANASLPGTVVAARCAGGSGVDNRWYVVFSCNNLDGNNDHIVPMNYSFSDVDTTVTFA